MAVFDLLSHKLLIRATSEKHTLQSVLTPASRNALLYAVCGDDIHALMHAVTQFFPNRSVNEKIFAFFGPYAPDIAKQAESDA